MVHARCVKTAEQRAAVPEHECIRANDLIFPYNNPTSTPRNGEAGTFAVLLLRRTVDLRRITFLP